MSQHLIPVKTGNEQIPVQYRIIHNINPGCCCCVEHDSVLYCITQVYGYNDPGNVYVYRINLFTGESSLYATFTSGEVNQGKFKYIGQVLVDDNNIYFTGNPGTPCVTINTFKLRDVSLPYDPTTPLELVSSSTPTAWNIQNGACGRMAWYDDETIVLPYGMGLFFYNINTGLWSRKTRSNTFSAKNIIVGSDLIILTNSSTNSDTLLIYRKNTDEFVTRSLPTTTPCVGTYDAKNKQFLFANTNYLYKFDELTETVIASKNIPWTNPYSLEFSNNTVYAICTGSPKAYVYDMTFDQYFSFTLQWSVTYAGDGETKSPTYPCAVEGLWFIMRNSLCIVDYSGHSKYNFGYKFSSTTIMLNKQYMNQFTYDPRFVSFDDTYMFTHDGDISYELEPLDVETYGADFSVAHVNKADYKFINRAELI